MTNEELSQEQCATWLRLFAAEVERNAPHLTELDSAIGDADHGSNMARGVKAVVSALDTDYPTIAALTKKVGMTLVSTVGGASGPLYGTFFLRFAMAAGEATTLDAQSLGKALVAGAEGIIQRGKASQGDKTMVDVWLPAVDAYATAAEEGLAAAVHAMTVEAEKACKATESMVARKGRASYLGDRSKGHLDPGAVSSALLISALAQAVTTS